MLTSIEIAKLLQHAQKEESKLKKSGFDQAISNLGVGKLHAQKQKKSSKQS